MLRQVLSVSASVTLLAGLTACGDDDSGAGSPAPASNSDSASTTPASTPAETPTDAPPVAYKQSPGQADKVKAALPGYDCSELSDQYFTYTACTKPTRRHNSWIKFAAAKDGTVVTAKVLAFAEVKPAITAIVGSADAAVLVAKGTTLQWGYGGPNWISIKGLNSAPEPPQAEPFGTTRAEFLNLIKSDPEMHCEVDDAEATTAPTSNPGEVVPSVSPTPAPSSVRCQAQKLTANNRTSVVGTFAGGALTAIEVKGDYDFKGERPAFAPVRAATKKVLDQLWPVMKGGDTQALRTWVEAHLKPDGSAIGYVDGRKITVWAWSPPEADTAGLHIWVGNEKAGLDEPKG